MKLIEQVIALAKVLCVVRPVNRVTQKKAYAHMAACYEMMGDSIESEIFRASFALLTPTSAWEIDRKFSRDIRHFQNALKSYFVRIGRDDLARLVVVE